MNLVDYRKLEKGEMLWKSVLRTHGIHNNELRCTIVIPGKSLGTVVESESHLSQVGRMFKESLIKVGEQMTNAIKVGEPPPPLQKKSCTFVAVIISSEAQK